MVFVVPRSRAQCDLDIRSESWDQRWTERNNYIAWGLAQTSPTELAANAVQSLRKFREVFPDVQVGDRAHYSVNLLNAIDITEAQPHYICVTIIGMQRK